MSELDAAKDAGIFSLGNTNDAYAQYFNGQSYLNPLVADPAIPVNVGNVTFEPGCRNNWHRHIDGGYQLLLVTSGEGWYQEAGKKPQKLTVGDVVVIKEGVKHWHGAAKNSWFAHVAITAGASEWLEAVSDEEYDQLPDA